MVDWAYSLKCSTRPNENGGAVSVVPKQDVRIDDVEVLQMPAIAAQITIERIKLLRLLQAVDRYECIADRGRKNR